MIDFQGVTHLMANPSGHAEGYNYSLVGSVPLSMLERREPTKADVMGGRVRPDGYAYRGRKWETIDQVLTLARMHRVKLCESPTCGCRQLF